MTLRQCQLEGELPSYFGDGARFPKLKRLDLSSNALTGYVDAALFRGPSLSSIDLSKNALKGAEPTIASVVPINVYLNDLKTHGNAWDEDKGFEEVVFALTPPPQPACVAGPGGDSRLEACTTSAVPNGRPRYCAASGASIEFRESGPRSGPTGPGASPMPPW